MAGKHALGAPKHAAPRTQPFAGNMFRNMQPQQFGTRASGKVNTGMNPATYQGGSHRKGAGGGFNM